MKKLLLYKFAIGALLVFADLQNTEAQQYNIKNTWSNATLGYASYNLFDTKATTNIISGSTTAATSTSYAPGFSPDPSVSGNKTSVITSATLAANNLSALVSSGNCLESKHQTTAKPILINFLDPHISNATTAPNATGTSGTFNNITGSTYDWEWSFIYKTSLAAASITGGNASTGAIASGASSWRYWIHASTSTISNTTAGYYLTENSSGKIVLVAKAGGGGVTTMITSNTTVTAGTTYIIKVQRISTTRWLMFMDVYSPTTTEASTMQGGASAGTYSAHTSDHITAFNYVNSVLEAEDANTAADGAFKFDELKMYTRHLEMTPIADASYGVTQSPLYPGAAIIFGIELDMRGTYVFGSQMYFNATINNTGSGIQNNFTGSATLYQTTSSNFSTATGTSVGTSASFFTGSPSPINIVSSANVWSTSGNYDGTVNIPGYYFLAATVASPAPNLGSTYKFTSISSQENNGNNTIGGVISNTGTTQTQTFGSAIDWTGNVSHTWSTAGNWSGGVVPTTSSQLARIGVVTYGANDPQLTANATPGNVTFGTAKNVVLDLNGKTLTTTAVLQNSNTVYSATRTTTITNTSATAANLTVASLTNNDNMIFANGSGTTNVNISGNYTNNKMMTIGTDVPFVFTSASAQTLTDANTTLGTGTNFNDITFTGAGPKTITGGDFGVINTGILTLAASADLFINSAASLTLYTGTTAPYLNYAQIATIPSGSTIQGNINYQVYFTGGAGLRNYRSMGSPVYDNTTTYTLANGTYKYSNLKNSFIITGAGGSANGFDNSWNFGATLRTYNSATDDYAFINSLTSSTIATGKGFFMYFRGDRTHITGNTTLDPFGSKTNKADGGGLYATPEAVTYTYTGIPNQGSVSTQFGTDDDNYYFISNPYAATLDANALINSTDFTASLFGFSYASNYITTKIWTWKPGATAQYAVWDQTNPTASPNGAKQYIVPGQGFFVQANTNSGISWLGINASPNKLTLIESMKSTGNNLNAVRQLSAQVQTHVKPLPILRLQFHKDNITNDEIGMVFQDSTKAAYDKHDAVHFDGTALTLSSLTDDNKYLAIDYRPFTNNKTVIPLYITAETDTTYSLNLSYKNDLMQNYKITLYDSLLNTNNIISKNSYSFQVASSQAATYGKRFKLIIEPEPAVASFTKFGGKLNQIKKVLLNWNSASDRSNITYQVQRSTDKKAFANIGQVVDAEVNNPDIDYQTLDGSPAVGANYYRLLQTDLFGNIIYSDTVTVFYNPGLLAGTDKNGFVLYPNSVKDVLSIVSANEYKGKVNMTIYDSQGNLKHTQVYQGINAQLPIQENVSQLQLGVYIIHLASNGKELVTLKFNKEQN